MAVTISGTTGVGVSTTPSYPVDVYVGTLGTTANSQLVGARLLGTSGTNGDILEVSHVRGSAGTDWQTAGWRLQQRVDNTWMGYIQFNGTASGANNNGISIGTGSSAVNANSVAERLRIDATGNVTVSTGNVTVSGNVQAASYNGGQLAGLRNSIINGNMSIWQRGTAAYTSAANGTFSADRWYLRSSYTGGTTNITQGTGPSQTLRYTTRVTHATATATTTGQYYALRQVFEKIVARGFASASSITISFWYRSNRTGSHACVFDAGSAGAFFTGTTTGLNTTFTVNVADTWEYKSITVPLTITGNGTNADNLPGALLTIGFTDAAVSTFTTIAVGDYFEFTGAQLEFGAVATPFENRPYGMELVLCQRYFQKSYDISTAPGAASTEENSRIGIATSTTRLSTFVVYPVSMRSTDPVITFYSPVGTAGQYSTTNNITTNTGTITVANNHSSDNGFHEVTVVGATAGTHYQFHYTASAEI